MILYTNINILYTKIFKKYTYFILLNIMSTHYTGNDRLFFKLYDFLRCFLLRNGNEVQVQ
ncbi:hypothetical protein E6C60_4088 [Paenibacillus algicola]|uniref:Uncharacterized protein n=1 Tax=Paenibacillus algicola TaxID=2565926 RepID=A0A4P8XQJ6_9BACL|nr:hypothetical protein E6C60_4088 [Paenibacillus algicola]